MERQIPKNVRQIGNVSDSPKIYVEDYVDTFFLQLCDKAKDGPIGAFLVGDMQKSEDEEYVYMNFNTKLSPCIINPETDENYTYLLLPVRI